MNAHGSARAGGELQTRNSKHTVTVTVSSIRVIRVKPSRPPAGPSDGGPPAGPLGPRAVDHLAGASRPPSAQPQTPQVRARAAFSAAHVAPYPLRAAVAGPGRVTGSLRGHGPAVIRPSGPGDPAGRFRHPPRWPGPPGPVQVAPRSNPAPRRSSLWLPDRAGGGRLGSGVVLGSETIIFESLLSKLMRIFEAIIMNNAPS